MSPHDNIALDKQSRRSWLWGIRTRLIVFFTVGFVTVMVSVELAGIMGIPFVSYSGRRGEQRAEALHSLDLIADLKRERLYRWLKGRCDDARVGATNDMVEENVTRLCDAADRFAAESLSGEEVWDRLRKEGPFGKLVRYLGTIKRSYGVGDEIQIVDTATWRVLVSTDETAVGDDVSDQAYYVGPMWSHQPYVGPIILNGKSAAPILHFNHVIHKREVGSEVIEEQGDEPIAMLVIKVHTDDIIKHVLHTGAGLGKSGEALLVDSEGMLLTSLKHPLPDGTVPGPLQHKITAQPAVLAARGEEGLVDSRDYRGEPVVAAYRHIRITPEAGWGLVVKRDKAELFAPLRADLVYTLLLGSVGVVAFIGLAVVLAGSLTRPIRSLSQTAEKVAAGDLSRRGPVTTSDEVGLLAMTFNTMVDRVEKWHAELRNEVHDRTVDLRKTNESLTMEIADRKLAEEGLRKSEGRFRTIFEQAPLGVAMVHSHTGQFVRINPKYCDIVGYTEEEMLSLDFKAITHPDDLQKSVDKMTKLTQGNIPLYKIEKRYIRKDRSIVWVSLTVVRVRSGREQPEFHLAMVEDITDRKLAQREREELIARLEAQNAELERFAYTVSHDLKSPLITTKGYVGMLREDLAQGDSEAVEDDLSRISNAADKMNRLLGDLLELSRIGRLVNPPEDVPLEELAKEALQLVGGQIKQRSVQVDILPDLPVVFGDRARLLEVLQNLVDNAVKYLGDESHPRIEIGARQDGNDPVCYVRDNGIGIEPRYHEKIFKLFDQLDQKMEGSGIGLALVKRIIEVHGGRVWVESEGAGCGSTFCFTIPPSSES